MAIKKEKIIKILKKYSSIFDGCIAPEDFEDVAINIKKIVDKEINNVKTK